MGTGLIVAALAAAAVILTGTAYSLLHPAPSRIADVTRCLRDEKHLAILSPLGDAVAASARAGNVATQVESNGVTISLARTTDEAHRMLAAYGSYGIPSDRLTIQDRLVALWQRPPTTSQLQTIDDCNY